MSQNELIVQQMLYDLELQNISSKNNNFKITFKLPKKVKAEIQKDIQQYQTFLRSKLFKDLCEIN